MEAEIRGDEKLLIDLEWPNQGSADTALIEPKIVRVNKCALVCSCTYYIMRIAFNRVRNT